MVNNGQMFMKFLINFFLTGDGKFWTKIYGRMAFRLMLQQCQIYLWIGIKLAKFKAFGRVVKFKQSWCLCLNTFFEKKNMLVALLKQNYTQVKLLQCTVPIKSCQISSKLNFLGEKWTEKSVKLVNLIKLLKKMILKMRKFSQILETNFFLYSKILFCDDLMKCDMNQVPGIELCPYSQYVFVQCHLNSIC